MALRISHISTSRGRPPDLAGIVVELNWLRQVAGISLHVALSVLCIFTIRSLRRVSLLPNLLFKHPLWRRTASGLRVKGSLFCNGCWEDDDFVPRIGMFYESKLVPWHAKGNLPLLTASFCLASQN